VNNELVSGQPARFRRGQSTFDATIQEQQGTSSTFLVVFKSNRREDEYIDLQLTKAVNAGGYSWWRLDGYETWDEGDEDDEEVSLDGEVGDEGESDSGDESESEADEE
jgi:hypothetical protein